MQTIPAQRTEAQIQVNTFIRSVYNWMAIGLGLTGFVAFYVSSNDSMLRLLFEIVGNQMRPSMLFYGLIIGELVLVFSLAGRVNKMQASTATSMFVLYAALNGATLSSIFIIYTRSSIASTFFICAATFVASSIYGMVTKRDLTSFGQFMFMGFIGIFIATIVNIFIGSYGLQMIISYIGVIVFVGLTAYDTQKLKAMSLSQPAGLDAGVVRKGAIIGALQLYLDFILMFQYLLFILGGRD
jgi:hypothetical protein